MRITCIYTDSFSWYYPPNFYYKKTRIFQYGIFTVNKVTIIKNNKLLSIKMNVFIGDYDL